MKKLNKVLFDKALNTHHLSSLYNLWIFALIIVKNYWLSADSMFFASHVYESVCMYKQMELILHKVTGLEQYNQCAPT